LRFLIDCDVLLDVILDRAPHADHSSQLLDWAEACPGRAGVAWHTFATVYYMGGPNCLPFLRRLASFVVVPATGSRQLHRAFTLEMGDFEDAMQVSSAECFGAQFIVSRNLRDYIRSPIKAIPPKEALTLLKAT